MEQIECIIKEVPSMKISAAKLLNATCYTDFSIEGKLCVDIKHQSAVLDNCVD